MPTFRGEYVHCWTDFRHTFEKIIRYFHLLSIAIEKRFTLNQNQTIDSIFDCHCRKGAADKGASASGGGSDDAGASASASAAAASTDA